MRKRVSVFLMVLFAALSVPAALSQVDSSQTVYTYVSWFQVPRGDWEDFTENMEKTFVPAADKLLAGDTILSWSTFETVVHSPDGYTHGAAWSSTSLAGLMSVLDALRKMGPPLGQRASKHEDLLMQSITYHAVSGRWTSGYLAVACQSAKPDRPDDYAAAVAKYFGPAMDDQFKKGVATSYSLEQQYLNTAAPSTRCLAVTYPNADNMDMWAAAISAAKGKMRQADQDLFYGATQPDSRRDVLARLTHYVHK